MKKRRLKESASWGGRGGGANGNGYKNANTSAVAVESLEVSPSLPSQADRPGQSAVAVDHPHAVLTEAAVHPRRLRSVK